VGLSLEPRRLCKPMNRRFAALVITENFFLLQLDKEFHKTLAKRKIIEKKMFPKQHSPNLLTWAEKETIR
jgi:hypothetical protein